MFLEKDQGAGDKLNRFAEKTSGDFVYQPARICPQIKWLDPNYIRILEGGLANKEFRVETELLPQSAAVYLYDQDQQIGKVAIERSPPGKGIILWDAIVHPLYRQNGLAAIMTWIIFRRLLNEQTSATFRIRMVRSLKTTDNGVQLQNVGMGVIALRLGFSPELNLKELLRWNNVTEIGIIPENQTMPPGLRISLHTDPLILIAFVLNPDTMKPIRGLRTYIEMKRDLSLLHDWASLGLLVVNGNYILRTPRIDHFVNRIALDETEALNFRNKIKGL